MIAVLTAAIVTGCATVALPAAIRHIETIVANKRLTEAHRTATERGSMNPLPGNPHSNIASRRLAETPIPIADDVQINFGFDALTQATLALAHEQRTQNLISLAALCTANGRRELGEPLIELAAERLGLNGGDS